MADAPPATALKIVKRKVTALEPYARNARTHSERQIEQIAGSIREFGWTNPVLIDGANGIIAGHGRVLAAILLEMKEVPCIVLDHLDADQKRALVLADNQLALNAGWNTELLRLELHELKDVGFKLDVIGFEPFQLVQFMADPKGLSDPNEVPDPPADPITLPGDVWILGDHRILCGDATCAEDVEKLLAGAEPHLMVTDPPYGVDYDPEWRTAGRPDSSNIHGGLRAVHSFRNAEQRTGVVGNDDRADWTEAWKLFPGDVCYVWHGALHAGTVQANLEAAGFDVRSQIIWKKQNAPISRGDYHWQHEPCWYAVRKGKTGHWHGDRKQTTVWDIDSLNPVGRKGAKGSMPENDRTNHSTQKPVDCMRRPIENNSMPGQAVYEPFSGSGTTIMACQIGARTCYALELDPSYVDMAVERWQRFTGREATLEDDGRTFGEVGTERLKGVQTHGKETVRPGA